MLRISKPKFKTFAEFWEADGRKIVTGSGQIDLFFGWNARQGEINLLLNTLMDALDAEPSLEPLISAKLEEMGYSIQELRAAFLED